jgi:hypothetical protein
LTVVSSGLWRGVLLLGNTAKVVWKHHKVLADKPGTKNDDGHAILIALLNGWFASGEQITPKKSWGQRNEHSK